MDYKQLTDYFLEEMKAENVATRKCLEHIPPTVYSFKPHERSMEMGYLTLLVAEIPRWIKVMIEDSVIDFATYAHNKLSDTAGLLRQYDENFQGALRALENISDEQVKTEFSLRHGTQLLMSGSKLKSIGETINHWVHHRGQLTVYMRLNDIPVPSIYGPSADDKNYSRS